MNAVALGKVLEYINRPRSEKELERHRSINDSKIPSLTQYARLMLIYGVASGLATYEALQRFSRELLEAQVCFIMTERQTFQEFLDDIVERGQLTRNGDGYTLTESGLQSLEYFKGFSSRLPRRKKGCCARRLSRSSRLLTSPRFARSQNSSRWSS